jgi:hypothetical protein
MPGPIIFAMAVLVSTTFWCADSFVEGALPWIVYLAVSRALDRVSTYLVGPPPSVRR